MLTESEYCLQDDFITELFASEYQRLIRYAEIIFRKRGVYADPIGRAEDVVQETFYLACAKRDDLINSDDPGRWLTATVTYKIREAVREDRKWVKNLMLLPGEDQYVPFPEMDVLKELIPAEDYDLLKRLYIEGYSYKELCGEFGVSKSTLGMRIKRIKESFKKKHGKIFE